MLGRAGKRVHYGLVALISPLLVHSSTLSSTSTPPATLSGTPSWAAAQGPVSYPLCLTLLENCRPTPPQA